MHNIRSLSGPGSNSTHEQGPKTHWSLSNESYICVLFIFIYFVHVYVNVVYTDGELWVHFSNVLFPEGKKCFKYLQAFHFKEASTCFQTVRGIISALRLISSYT